MKKFKLKPGQVDYTNIRYAPVINCVLKYMDKILIVQRSAELNFYPEYWNGISGFLDDDRSFSQKVKDEIREELSLGDKYIDKIIKGKIFHQESEKHQKTWIVHPVLVLVNNDNIKLDWESQDYKWVDIKETKKFNLLPGFDRVLDEASKLF